MKFYNFFYLNYCTVKMIVVMIYVTMKVVNQRNIF
jgi:hypothetical protein